MFKIGVIVILLIGFTFNIYKFKIMSDCMTSNTPYKIFPWSESMIDRVIDSKQESKSSIYWLLIHLAISLENFIISALIILDIFKCNYINLIMLHNIIHIIFTLIVISNIFILGNLTSVQALIINGIVLIIMTTSWLFNKYWIYFLVLSLPIFLEFLSSSITLYKLYL